MHSFFISFLIAFNLLYSQIYVEKITNNLDKPVYATSIMLDVETIFIVEQDGIIKIIKDSKLDAKMLFLDIKDRVLSPFYPGDERGLLGFALDPNFKQNGYFYVNYVNKDDFSIVSRFSSDNLISDKYSEKNIITIKQPYSNHNGGHLAFGPDGYLYISFGDGGSSGDPEQRGQNLNSLLGKILRIDINKNLYDIPKNNPFYSNGDACDCSGNVLDECDECGGNGIDEGKCDCDGNVFDCTGTCAGVALDTDNDGVCDNDGDEIDLCPDGNTDWISTPLTDYDSDGCQDNGEDTDDDNDTLLDCWDYWHDDGELISEEDMTDLINSGECEDFALEIDQNTIPTEFFLHQNHPNPFNPSTTIKFSIPHLTNVDLNIYNVLGQQIYKKSWEKLLPGNYEHIWNGEEFTSGIYIYAIETNSGIYLKEKMVLIK